MPDFKIAGIGASAGGLSALRALFDRMTAEPGLPFVIVVHLAPNQKSHLAELLQPHAKMPVQQVNETTRIEPNHIYVIPPNANLDAVDTHLRLSSLEARRFDRAPIDHFFRTLADSSEGSAIGVVLSGSGTDGTLGLRRIKERGGVTIVQDPGEAEYDGMPRSAIAAGVVDLVLPVEEIAARIIGIAKTSPGVPPPDAAAELGTDENRIVAKIFAQVRARTGHDFSEYKRSTIMRRIGRRMQVNQIETLGDYLAVLRQDRREVGALFDDLLITVTEFFRDPHVFEQLAKDVVPRLFDRRRPEDAVRIWCAGCATGEEAYSIAMLMLEEASKREVHTKVQIFATDLHGPSLKSARDGVYSESIGADVSPERLRRFFVLENGGYRVRKEVRELVLFAAHDLLKDPPFSHLDLIVCRNLLIYLQRDVQNDVVSLFHYALDPDGLVLLGTAETIDGTELFQPEIKPICLYRRRSVPTREPRLPVFPYTPRKDTEVEGIVERAVHPIVFGAVHAKLVEQYAPPSMLVNDNHEVVHYSAHAGRYLKIPGGEPTNNVFKLIREPLQIELRSTLQSVKEKGVLVSSRAVPMPVDGTNKNVVIRIRPAPDEEWDGLYLVFFDESEDSSVKAPGDGEAPGTVMQRELEAELELYKQRLQSVIEEFETTKEEMRASNEEMQSTNEELRSTMEELETSKEELQSMNEELATVNQENRHRVEELSQLSGDLQNLLSATDIATLFLDRDLRIVRFTPRVAELFNIRNTDKGRPISDLTHRMGESALSEDAHMVLSRLVPVERELQSEGQRWYLVRILPYRSAEDRIEGVVITFVDITERKIAGEALRLSEESFQRVQNVEGIGVMHLDGDGRLIGANATMQKMFGWSPDDVMSGKMSWRQWTPPEYVSLSEQERRRMDETGRMGPYEKEILRKDGTRAWMIFAGSRLGDGTLIEYGIDVSDRKFAETSLKEADRRKNEFMAILAHELRNPLAPIVTGLEVLRDSPTPAEAEHVRQIMERQARQLVRLVDDLMDVSRIVGGRLQVRMAPCDLNAAVQDAVDAIRPLVTEAQHALTAALPDEPVIIHGDRDRVTQVVSNLLSNAVKYTPRKGRIAVTVREDRGSAEVIVADNGIGIQPEMRERVFEMFTQVPSDGESSRSGLGIGLTLVKSIIDRHGGSVRVESGPEKRGSQFVVRLPLSDERPRREKAAVTRGKKAPARILIADDQVDAAQMLAMVLERSEHEVKVVSSGEEALTAGKKLEPDIVMLDLGMPSMDGFEAARRVRATPWGKDVTLVAVTGWGQDEDRRQSREAGFDHHVVKPADLDELQEIIARAPRRK